MLVDEVCSPASSKLRFPLNKRDSAEGVGGLGGEDAVVKLPPKTRAERAFHLHGAGTCKAIPRTRFLPKELE
jgi:hypothetical protein